LERRGEGRKLNGRSLDFLKKLFSIYYSSLEELWIPGEMEKREFGFFLGKEMAMVRHRSFESAEALHKFLVQEAPFDVYYSVATYDNPEEVMSQKGWRGADIVFDIDADHLEHKCRDEHDLWICRTCGRGGVGAKPSSCPYCGKKEFDEINWICDQCLGMAKMEVYKLVEVLTEDFGFGEENIEVFFSGHRGYHVHVKGSMTSIDQAARKELVDYLTGTGIDLELHGLSGIQKGSKRLVTGWGTRIARSIYEMIDEKGLDGKLSEDKNVLAKRKRRILEELMSNNFETLQMSLNKRNFEALLALAIEKVSIKIDPVVTTDIHRLFRLPETLNSKTGFSKRRIPPEQLASFNPLRDAVVLSGDPIKVSIKCAPRFSLSGRSYGPYSDEVATVPQEVAVLLLCKGVAECSG
jgi:DNA primase small subunit